MMTRQPVKTETEPLSTQVKRRVLAVRTEPRKSQLDYDGDFGTVIHTGSTLLDLAISGGRVHGGGLPGGILVEIFGPSGSGKTVLLSEIAGAVQRQGGQIKFDDPEARLNKQFAKIFHLDLKEEDYNRPNTVPEVFKPVRAWRPKSLKVINGYFADSLAALSTQLEMGDSGDKIGMRRAKEFSEECRKTCRVIADNNYLMVCSNQVRENIGAGEYEVQYKSTGGEAIGFYASLRLRTLYPQKIKKTLTPPKAEKDKEDEEDDTKKKKKGNERIVGVRVNIEVFKSSIWMPYRTAPVTIIFDYGIDDIKENLQFVKEQTKSTTYTIGGQNLDAAMDIAVKMIEKDNLEKQLQEEVITLWEQLELKFASNRKPKI
jgi:recombination protein RecA